ncbi:MAG: hypothetical protein IJN42_05860 [Clostridia bacterium]|nr:hypothetical protein [Clostridia bacterium]
MKKALCFMLVLLLCLSAGCNQPTAAPGEEITDISQCIVSDESGRYLILPISKEKVVVRPEDAPYLEEIDLEMLKAAEKKIYAEMEKYERTPICLLTLDHEKKLCLSAEEIISLPPEEIKENEACGDHKHIYFQEKITK